MRVLTIQWVVKMWAPSHQTGNQRHLKISLSNQVEIHIHEAKYICVLPSLDACKTKRRLTLPETTVLQFAATTVTVLVRVMANSTHVIPMYFLCMISPPPPAVKFIWFANVYNLPQLCFRIDFFNLFTPFFLGGGRPELHGLCTVVLDFHFGRWESYIIFVFWSCIQSTYIQESMLYLSYFIGLFIMYKHYVKILLLDAKMTCNFG